MKKLKLFLALFLLPLFVVAQDGQLIKFGGSRPQDTAHAARSLRFDSVMRAVYYATSDTNKVLGINAQGFLVLRTKGNGSGTTVDTSSLSARIDARVKYSDTAAMLSPYYRTATATAALATKQAYSDTNSYDATKTNLADTSALLRTLISGSVSGVSSVTATAPLASSGGTTPNITADTAVLSTRAWRQKGVDSLDVLIAARVKYSDTGRAVGNIATGGSLLKVRDSLQTNINLKANLAGPTFTGVPAAPTASAGTNTTQLATTAFVTTADNLKANLAGPTFTGVPAAPTASAGTNTTQIATTAFVTTADNLKLNIANPTATGTLTTPALTISSLSSGTTNDSVLVADAATGAVKRISSSRISAGGGGGSGTDTGAWHKGGDAVASVRSMGTSTNYNVEFVANALRLLRLYAATYGVAIGEGSVASGFWSNAFGYGAICSGQHGVAIGSYTDATDVASIAIGYSAESNHFASWNLSTNGGSGAYITSSARQGILGADTRIDHQITPGVNILSVTADNVISNKPVSLKSYTVAGLPSAAANTGAICYVTDASAPTYNATVTGGGSVLTLVFSNGTNWTCH